MSALVDSEVVGPWKPPMSVICEKAHVEPDPCDCGFEGDWEWRMVFVWHDQPGHVRGDKAVRRDIERGLPPCFGEEGWWVVGGVDERCPGCGDIERFDVEALFGKRSDFGPVRRWSEQAKVVVFLAARRQDRRA